MIAASTTMIVMRITGLRLLMACFTLFMSLCFLKLPRRNTRQGLQGLEEVRNLFRAQHGSNATIVSHLAETLLSIAEQRVFTRIRDGLCHLIFGHSGSWEHYVQKFFFCHFFCFVLCAQALIDYPMAYSTMRSYMQTDTSSLSISVIIERIMAGVISPFVAYLHILSRSSQLTIHLSLPLETRINL